MKESPLTQTELKALLNYDPETGEFTWRVRRRGSARAGSVAGSKDSKGKRQIKVGGQLYFAHRLAWFYMTGRWPTLQIDHIDRDPDNNAWCNLREATGSQNCANRIIPRRRHHALPRGVHPSNERFAALIEIRGRPMNLGIYDTPEEARLAYRRVARAAFGEFMPD